MRVEELLELLRQKPFISQRVHLADGRTHDIHHPDQVFVLRSRIDIAIPADPATGVIDRVEHVSLLHVVRVEELHSASTSGGNGPPANPD